MNFIRLLLWLLIKGIIPSEQSESRDHTSVPQPQNRKESENNEVPQPQNSNESKNSEVPQRRKWIQLGKIVSVVGLIAAIIPAVETVRGWLHTGRPQPVSYRFSCRLWPDQNRGGIAWAVLYRDDRGTQPWLKMAPQEKCKEIAQGLEKSRSEGLVELAVHPDPGKQGQYIIGAKTRTSGESYLPLATVKFNADLSQDLYEIAGALLPTGVNQSSSELSASKPSLSLPLVINVENQLANEDLKAGSAAK